LVVYYLKNRTTEAAELSMRGGQTRGLASRSQPKMLLRRLMKVNDKKALLALAD